MRDPAEIAFEVAGAPPIKNEALSLLLASHKLDRVEAESDETTQQTVRDVSSSIRQHVAIVPERLTNVPTRPDRRQASAAGTER